MSTTAMYKEWKVGSSVFRAVPEVGARLMDWKLTTADGNVREVIYWPEDADMSNLRKVRGGNPILFPFVARSYDQGQEGFWRTADGIRRPMPRHGFSIDGKFSLEENTESGFTALFKPDPKKYECYPFDYNFKVRYQFEELSFTVDLILENTDSRALFWCAGHHFYFKLPWHEGLERKNYVLNIPTKKAFHRNEDGSLCRDKGYKNPATFDDDALIDRMHYELEKPEVSFGPQNGEENIIMKVSGNPAPSPWMTVNTWTEDKDSPFYCVEPWMGPPNNANLKKGLEIVEPGQTQTFTVKVSLA